MLDDLTVVDAAALPDRVLDGGQIGEMMWIVGHPPDGPGLGGWWPLTGDLPTQPSTNTGCSLFSTPRLGSTPIRSSQPDVTIDGVGTVWVTATPRGPHAIPEQMMTSRSYSMSPTCSTDLVPKDDPNRGPSRKTSGKGR